MKALLAEMEVDGKRRFLRSALREAFPFYKEQSNHPSEKEDATLKRRKERRDRGKSENWSPRGEQRSSVSSHTVSSLRHLRGGWPIGPVTEVGRKRERNPQQGEGKERRCRDAESKPNYGVKYWPEQRGAKI